MKTLTMLVALLLASSFAFAEMYQWVDEKGVVTFKDTPPPASKKQKKVKTYSESDFDPAPAYQPPPKPSAAKTRSVEPAAAKPAAATGNHFNGTVELYVTEWCGYCKKAISYLQSRKVPYVTYDIEKDSAARTRHAELGGRGVPLIVIGSHKMSGFFQTALDAYLQK